MKKKLISVLICAAMVGTSVMGCGDKAAQQAEGTKETTTEGSSDLSGKKVAVVRNLANGDHTQQFLSG